MTTSAEILPGGRYSTVRIPALPEDVDALTAALRYTEAGLFVGPLRQGGKNPGGVLGGSWPSKTFDDAHSAAAWFAGTDYGVFLHAGRSGLVVLDVDHADRIPGDWWPHLATAPFQSTRSDDGRRGHYIFAVPDGLTYGNASIPGGGGEIRGANGVIVVAPTRHEKAAQGARYEWARIGPVPILPGLLVGVLPLGKAGDRAVTRREVAEFIAQHTAIDDELVAKGFADEPVHRFYRKIQEGESRHVAAVGSALWIAREAAAGAYPAGPALDTLRDAFVGTFGRDELADGRGAATEWGGILAWAIGQVSPEDVEMKRRHLEAKRTVAYLDLHRNREHDDKEASPTGPRAVTPRLDRRDAPEDMADDDRKTEPATWGTVDLTGYLDGTWTAAEAALMPRSDGVFLLYPGKTHSLHGESESGKSFIVQAETARLLELGERVLYVDFEDDPAAVVGRLLALGATPAAIAERLDYRRPERSPSSAAEIGAWEDMLLGAYALGVIDGVTEAMGLFGKSTLDNDEVTAFMGVFPRQLADRTGAAVVLIDHVTKDSGTRGRFAIGGQAKMAALSGAAYVVDVEMPLGKGLRGVLVLRVAKDRPGGVRGHSAPMKSDRTQEAARFRLDGREPGRLLWELAAPETDDEGAPRPFRPTLLMERVSQFLEITPGASGNQIETGVRGKRDAIRQAIDVLVAEGHVERVVQGEGRATKNRLVRPYSQANDPDADGARLLGATTPNDLVSEPRPSPRYRERGEGARSTSPDDVAQGEVGARSGRGGEVCACPNGRHGIHAAACPQNDEES